MKIRTLHRWDVTPEEAVDIQRKLQQRMFSPENSGGEIHLVAGADASFSRNGKYIYAAVGIFSFPSLNLIEERKAILPLDFPYIPGLLTFREGPVLLECFNMIENTPDVIIFDGQGIMHPRGTGIATHLGILLDIPSIGCAKTPLYGRYRLPDDTKGAYSHVKDKDGQIIGAVLRTRTGVKPVFVSQGNRIGLSDAIDIVLRCTTRYRLPEPVRFTHRMAKVSLSRKDAR